MTKPIYLDYAAATPMNKRVLAAMQPYFSEQFYNPSALYTGARQAKAGIDEARASVARSIGAKPNEIIFTAGGTESANLAVQGVLRQFPGGEVLTTAIEHDVVLKPAEQFTHYKVKVDDKGLVDLADLKQKITDKTVLVSVMYANNEVGSVQPIREVVEIAEQVKKQRAVSGNSLPLYVHSDACQAPLYLDVSVARLGVDLMTLNAGKLYGPKQSGILYVRAGTKLTPIITGGGQEFGLRSGTENVAAAAGMAKALELAVSGRNKRAKKASALSRYFADELEQRFGALLNGHRKQRLPNNVHVTFPGADNERVLFSLDDQGVYAAAGSACSASDDEASHVLLAMGKTVDEARASLRFSLGEHTTKSQLDRALKALDVALNA